MVEVPTLVFKGRGFIALEQGEDEMDLEEARRLEDAGYLLLCESCTKPTSTYPRGRPPTEAEKAGKCMCASPRFKLLF